MSRSVDYTREPAGAWVAQAVCRGSYDTHFPSAPSNTPLWHEQVARAQAMCAICPVRQECLELAIVNREREGIWGGLVFPNGRRVYRRRMAAAAAS